MLRVVVLSLALLSLLLAGCQQVAQKAVEQATGVQVNQQGDSMTVKGADGTQMSIGSLPEQLKEFPVPQGFTLDGGLTMTADGRSTAIANWKGTSQFTAVTDFYRKGLTGQGWQEETFAGDAKGMVATFRKGEDVVQVSVSTGEKADDLQLDVMLWKDTNQARNNGQSTPAANGATSAVSQASAAVTLAPTSTPAPPETTDPSKLPAELQDVPLPAGFSLVKDSVQRYAEAGKFKAADATWFGTTSPKDVSAFYRQALSASGWTEDSFSEGEDWVSLMFINEKDSELYLNFEIETTDAGTEVHVTIAR